MAKRIIWLAALAGLLMWALAALPCFAFEIGDSGEAVEQLQTALYALGYTEEKPDGGYGEKTRQTAQHLADWARTQGLTLDEEEISQAFLSGQLRPVNSVLREGDMCEAVQLLQRRLRALGYLADKADGQFGAHTRRALMLFQLDNHLDLTGESDEETRGLLFDANAPKTQFPVLSKGMKGDRVLDLQKRLRLMGFFTGDMDGQYGKDTVNGVKELQAYFRTTDGGIRDAEPTGIADPLTLSTLYGDFPLPAQMKENDEGKDVYRLQRRLIALGYLDQAPDGGYGGNTTNAVKAFQKQAGLKEKGAATEKTLALLFSEDAPEAIRPYKLVIDLSKQTIYVYKWSGKAYDDLKYTMACSAGAEIVSGFYKDSTRPDAPWMEINPLGWVRDCFLLEGSLRIHSVPFVEQDGDVKAEFLSALGKKSQYAGIMVSPENASLIRSKCRAGTPVEIIEG